MAERCFGQQLLETDGCNPAFFYLLAKENKRSLKSCELHIPMTILFEQGYVKALFTTEQTTVGGSRDNNASTSYSRHDQLTTAGANDHAPIGTIGGASTGISSDPPGEIKRKSGKDVDLNEVYDLLVAGTKEGDIVAELLFAKKPSGEMNTVQFLDAKMLHRFLFVDVDKPKSLLQRFIRPKGNNNFKILATWSPLMIMAEGRRCPNSLTSRHLPVSIRGATFEDATINAVDVVVNRTVVKGINEICCTMAAHFERTEKLSLTRFGGFFKVDENNTLYLTYPTSIRMHEVNAIDKTKAPVSLSAKLEISKNDLLRGLSTGSIVGNTNNSPRDMNVSMMKGGSSPFGRSKEALTQQALDLMDEVLEQHDKKMKGSDMIISIPSLEDNYTLIHNALHEKKKKKRSGGGGLDTTGGSALGVHGSSSVYVSGPVPVSLSTSAMTHQKRAASSMSGGGGAPIDAGSSATTARRAHSAMGNMVSPSPAPYEKHIGTHNNTNYANPKVHATSTRKTFYSSNMAGTVGSNPHAADPLMFVNPANTSANAPNQSNASTSAAAIGGFFNNNKHANVSKSQGALRQEVSAISSAPTIRKTIDSVKSGVSVPLTASTQLPQPKPLLQYQHALPNSGTNMSYPAGASTASLALAGGKGKSVVGGGQHQQPVTLRQLNHKSEKQIQNDWQHFTSQAQNDLKYWEAQEEIASLRRAREGALGGTTPFGKGRRGSDGYGGSSPTLAEAEQRVAALEESEASGRMSRGGRGGGLFGDTISSGIGGGAEYDNNDRSPATRDPPPVKAHSTYDPRRPQKALHVVHDHPYQNLNQEPQNGNSPRRIGGGEERRMLFGDDKHTYMDLVARRTGSPMSGTRAGAESGRSPTSYEPSAGLNNNNDNNNNNNNTNTNPNSHIAPPTDYESDAKLFVSAIQQEYVQQQTILSTRPRPTSSNGVNPIDGQHALRNVSKSVLLPAIFSPSVLQNSSVSFGSTVPTAVVAPRTKGAALSPMSGGGGKAAASGTARPNTADFEPTGLGGGGFGGGFVSSPSESGPANKSSRVLFPSNANSNTSHSPTSNLTKTKGAPSKKGMQTHSNVMNEKEKAPVASGQKAPVPTSSGYDDSHYAYGSNKTNNFLLSIESERAEAEQRMIGSKLTETSIILQNLTPAERETIGTQTDALVADFKNYLKELTYALYDLFLMRREGSKTQRFAYVEVPAKFQAFISAGVLNKILWKLHGKVHPILKFLADTMPQNDPNIGDVCEWRKQLLSGLQVGSLGRNWPCRGNFKSIGSFLEYCTTNLIEPKLLNPPPSQEPSHLMRRSVSPSRSVDNPSAHGQLHANNNNDVNELSAEPTTTSGVTINLICDALVFEQHQQGLGVRGGGGGNASQETQRGREFDAVLPISAIRRKSIIESNLNLAAERKRRGSSADGNNKNGFFSLASASYASSAGPTAAATASKNLQPIATSSRSNVSFASAVSSPSSPSLQTLEVSRDPLSPTNKPFTVSELIAKHIEERLKMKKAARSQKRAERVQMKNRLIQEARAAGLNEEKHLAAHGFKSQKREDGERRGKNNGGSYGNYGDDDDAEDEDYDDDTSHNEDGGEEEDEQEEILTDEYVRSFNKNFCIVIPLLDSKGLEIIKTEGFMIEKEAAKFFYGDAAYNNNNNSSSSLVQQRDEGSGGIIPIYAKRYILDQLQSKENPRAAKLQRQRERNAQMEELSSRQKQHREQQHQQDARKALNFVTVRSIEFVSSPRTNYGGGGSEESENAKTAISSTNAGGAPRARHQRILNESATTTTTTANNSNSGKPQTTDELYKDSANASTSVAATSPTFHTGTITSKASATLPSTTLIVDAPSNTKNMNRAVNAANNNNNVNTTTSINPLDIVCQRCNSCRVLCVCDRVYLASGGSRLRSIM